MRSLCAGRFCLSFLLGLFGIVDDLLGFADCFFQCADDFGRGFFAKIQKQLAFAIDASFALTTIELLKQFFDRQIQLGDFLVELVVIGFELQNTVSLFFDQLVFERQFKRLFLKRLFLADGLLPSSTCVCSVAIKRWQASISVGIGFASMMATL